MKTTPKPQTSTNWAAQLLQLDDPPPPEAQTIDEMAALFNAPRGTVEDRVQAAFKAGKLQRRKVGKGFKYWPV